MHTHKILILDFGSQVTQLIARRVRELRVYCEIYPFNTSIEAIESFCPSGLILSGSPSSVYAKTSYQANKALFKLGIPILGICYGMQWMAKVLGGGVEASSVREFGFAEIIADQSCALFHHIQRDGNKPLKVWMSHSDKVTTLPPHFSIIAHNKECPIAAMADETHQYYGLQFHPEVTQTLQGKAILKRFVIDICGCQPTWTMPRYINQALLAIQKTVGNEHVLLGLSGGVDSAVAALLIHRAIGEKLLCVFVDHGFLRAHEGKEVMHSLSCLGLKIIHIKAQNEFLKNLKGVIDPEKKRKIIGKNFVKVFQKIAKKHPTVTWLAQGTIYPDVIESGGIQTGQSVVIKSHHNVGGLPNILQLKLLEPLRHLFKDEVKQLGATLGIPQAILTRHPFPGPGLAIRIIGEVKKKYCQLLQKADAIFIEELKKNGWYSKISQAFAIFMPIKSVGVVGDGRAYGYVIGLRAVKTSDFMTAEYVELPYNLLGKISRRITNEVKEINRVVYDVSGKPPATVEWE